MFSFRKKKTPAPYDRATQRPVIRASICTGEQVAGFKDLDGGSFHEVMLIKTRQDLQLFMMKYGVEEQDITKEY